jgi:hypothetical protein
VEVQARGPVHEAYAEPSEVHPEPSLVVPKQPPDLIDEVPPDQKPEGDNVVWIGGYWSWDDDRQDFLWVSGFWRVPPPHHQWVPGNWQQVEGGWQWTPGFWAGANQPMLQYLPAPPPPLDAQSSTQPPDDTSTYVPGCWVYRETRYLWRPGFWVTFHPGWVWIPAHYVWTPGGYLLVEGYWDRPLEQRGLLFAPIRIDPALLAANWTYTPYYCVQPDFLLSALFVRPNLCHYYFGDFFEPRYQRRGFIAWVDYRPTRQSYDPNFGYYRQRFATDPGWERNLRTLYTGRREGTIARPPQTLVQQNTVVRNLTVNKTQNVTINKNINLTNIQNVSVLAPVTRIHNTQVTNLSSLSTAKTQVNRVDPHVIKVEPVPREHKAEATRAATQLRTLGQQRHEAETKAFVGGTAPYKPTDRPQPFPVELRPRTPAPTPKTTPERPITPTPARTMPTAPVLPRHEERPIPAHEPPRHVPPPKEQVQPKEPPPAKPPAPPPSHPPKDTKQPPPPKEPPAKPKPPTKPPTDGKQSQRS